MSKYYKKGDDPRPCQNNMKCIHASYESSENGCTEYCDVDYDGDECPYIKPWGRTKYRKDHGITEVRE